MAKDAGKTIAIVGATGAVGREMVSVLLERGFSSEQLRLFASERSAGARVEIAGEEFPVEEARDNSFGQIAIALFSAGGSVSEKLAPAAVEAGAIVIDNSSHFRMDPAVPLIVPEVNAGLLRRHLEGLPDGKGTIIANPNCSTIQLVVAVKPLHDKAQLRRMIVSTYQSVSGAGQKGMDELWEQSLGIFRQEEVKPQKFSKQIAFNCIPQIDVFLENGYTKEEMKVVRESRKILELPNLRVTCTAVRVPTFSCHGEAVVLEFESPLSADEARNVLRESPGVVVMDNPGSLEYPTAAELAGTNATYVGRIRSDQSCDSSLSLWIVADNLRKGAALNAVQIAEIALESRRVLH